MIATAKYTNTAITLHWVIAILMIINVILGFLPDFIPDSVVRPVVDTHKSIGITVLGLALLRLLWRFSHRPPPLPDSYPSWEKHSAHLAHWLLYGLIFALPISGWMHDSAWKDAPTHPMSLFWLIPWPRIAPIAGLDAETKEHFHSVMFGFHQYFGYALYALFALHVGGALKHQFLDREPELQRMVP